MTAFTPITPMPDRDDPASLLRRVANLEQSLRDRIARDVERSANVAKLNGRIAQLERWAYRPIAADDFDFENVDDLIDGIGRILAARIDQLEEALVAAGIPVPPPRAWTHIGGFMWPTDPNDPDEMVDED